MNSEQIAVILKSFDAPDEVRVMQKGKFELVHLGGITIGRATYEPGWKWSEHVGPSVGATRCPVEHVGLVLSGTATVAFDDGRVIELHAGDLFYVPPVPHDSWVIGDEPYVSLHFLGAEKYATESRRLTPLFSTLIGLKPGVNQRASQTRSSGDTNATNLINTGFQAGVTKR